MNDADFMIEVDKAMTAQELFLAALRRHRPFVPESVYESLSQVESALSDGTIKQYQKRPAITADAFGKGIGTPDERKRWDEIVDTEFQIIERIDAFCRAIRIRIATVTIAA